MYVFVRKKEKNAEIHKPAINVLNVTAWHLYRKPT